MLLEIIKWLLLIAAMVCVFALRGIQLLIPVGLVLLHALLDLFTKQHRIRANEKQEEEM